MAYARHKRVLAPRRKPPTMQHKPFAAPTAGWVSATNLAAAQRGAAQRLENFYPTQTGIRMRRGSRKHATAVAGQPIESTMSYVGSSIRKLFAACNGSIFDLTTVADPDVPPAADISGLTSSYFSHANMATSGGYFMLAANGTDTMRKYDGAAWSTIASGGAPGEIDGVGTDKISHVNVYRNRVWMVEGGTMNAWYLPTDAIAGAASKVSLAGVFGKGGALLFTATWSLDSGNGLDDKIVFASTEGEVAVYESDPADAGGWRLVGRYDASPPLGKNAYLTVGGDLLILTEMGLITLSAIMSKDPAALAATAISAPIQPDWQTEARERRVHPWEIVKWTSRNIAYVTCPVVDEVTPPICFAVNLETGAWAKITGWNTRTVILVNDGVYFGRNDGRLMQADVGGSDDGTIIRHVYLGHVDHLDRVGQYKTIRQARAIFRTRAPIIPRVAAAVDYETGLPAFPDAPPTDGSPGTWDVGLWDLARWDIGAALYTARTMWVSVGKSGYAHAPILLMSSGAQISADAELVVFEVTFEPGAIVV
jgi:hypothetical protein